jgi:DNA-binding transcriptional MerR regulator
MPDSDRIFTLQALVREFDVTSRTLRYYEEQGLLSPQRAGQRRLYSARDRARLRLVLICRRAGMALRHVVRLLSVGAPLEADAGPDADDVATLRRLIAALTQRRSDLDELISAFEHMHEGMSLAWGGRAAAIRREGACSILPFRPRAEPDTDR